MPTRIRPLVQFNRLLRPVQNKPHALIVPRVSFQCLHPRHASILSALSDNEGAYNKRIRRGRGPSSGKGKTSGRGHKGQKQHGKVPFGFQGGQTPQRIVQGERGFVNRFSVHMEKLNLDKVQSWIDQGRLNPSRPITLVELVRSGCISDVKDGIKLLARGSEHLRTPIHIVISQASSTAISAIEKAGGSVTTRYYTPFSIKKILNGLTDPIHSRLFQPTPVTQLAVRGKGPFEFALPDPTKRRDLEYYRDPAHRGYLSYLVPEGQGPSLFFKTPGIGVINQKRKPKKASGENKVW